MTADAAEDAGQYELVVTALNGWSNQTQTRGNCTLLRRKIRIETNVPLQYIIGGTAAGAVLLVVVALLAYQIRVHKDRAQRIFGSFVKHEGQLALKICWDVWVRPARYASGLSMRHVSDHRRCLQDIGGDGAQTIIEVSCPFERTASCI